VQRTLYFVFALLGFLTGGVVAFFLLPGRENLDSENSTGLERPYYETLALDSPEAAVREFLRAWQRDDLCTAYLVFAAETQYTFWITLNTGEMDAFISDPSSFQEDLKDLDFKPGSHEHAQVGLGHFELFVGVAKRTGGLPINLESPVSIRGTESVAAEGNRKLVDVMATCESHPSLVFRMVQSKSGRWRLLYVILPDKEPPVTWPVPADASWLPQPSVPSSRRG
jgi:hypothetical protein